MVYEYQSLPDDKTSFRLLELLPGKPEDEIRCRLSIESIGNHPPYEAISYVWTVLGGSKDKVHVFCRHHRAHKPWRRGRLEIPWNLGNALKTLRREDETRMLWADAICINQDDKQERGHQVRIMGPIFARAARVLIWLGRGSDFDAGAAFDLLRLLAPVSSSEYKKFTTEEMISFQNNIARITPTQWRAFGELLEYPWFMRVWVLQEVGFAADALLICGTHEFPWSKVPWICRLIYDNHRKIVMNYGLRVTHPFRMGSLEFKSSTKYQKGAAVVFQMARITKSTDPRDKVYALLGHSSLKELCRKLGVDTLVPIDYTQSHYDLYLAIATKLMARECTKRPLELLSYVVHTDETINDTENVASWAPQWNVRRVPSRLARSGAIFDAALSTPPELSFHGRAIQVQGVCFDSIIWNSESFSPQKLMNPLITRSKDTVSFLQTAWGDFKDTYLSRSPEEKDENLIRKFCWTLTAGDCREVCHNDGDPDIIQCLANFLSYCENVGIHLPSRKKLKKKYGIGDCDGFLQSSTWASLARRLFITEKGYVGLGPDVLSPGDKVCVFFSGDVPFVLWPQPYGGYRLCGECFVYGIMDGEAIDQLDDGELVEETFTIT